MSAEVSAEERLTAVFAELELERSARQRAEALVGRLELKNAQYQQQLDDKWAGVVGVTNAAVQKNRELQALVGSLRQALVGVAERELIDGLPCYCYRAPLTDRDGLPDEAHAEFCQVARHALADDAAAQLAEEQRALAAFYDWVVAEMARPPHYGIAVTTPEYKEKWAAVERARGGQRGPGR